MATEEELYEKFLRLAAAEGTTYGIAVTIEVSREEFVAALRQAELDAASFWQEPPSARRGLGLMLVHVEELVATSKDAVVTIVTDTDHPLRSAERLRRSEQGTRSTPESPGDGTAHLEWRAY